MLQYIAFILVLLVLFFWLVIFTILKKFKYRKIFFAVNFLILVIIFFTTFREYGGHFHKYLLITSLIHAFSVLFLVFIFKWLKISISYFSPPED